MPFLRRSREPLDFRPVGVSGGGPSASAMLSASARGERDERLAVGVVGVGADEGLAPVDRGEDLAARDEGRVGLEAQRRLVLVDA